jgi:type VI secretion system ImpC/EvpB family protein
MAGTTQPLREAVRAGRFTGDLPAAADLARLVASSDPALTLDLWFGTAALATLAAAPDRAGALRAALDRDIAWLDAALSRALDALLAHPRLVRLEGSWRGLHWLVGRLPHSGQRLRLKMLQARWGEVCRDLERTVEFDRSQLFQKIHDAEFGVAGGEPYGLLIGDYEVRHRSSRAHPTDDVAALQGLAGIAAAAFAPLLVGAAPELLGLETFADMTPGTDPGLVMRDEDHQRWRQAAGLEDLRFVGVVLPRVLGRAPWADDGTRVDRFRYRGIPPPAAGRVWTNAVYAFAATAVRAFDRYSWPAEVRGADIAEEARAGVVEGLPVERFASDPRPGLPARAPLEVALTDQQEKLIGDAALVPLAALDGLPEACFGALPALHRPPRLRGEAANANQRLSVQLNTMLCVSRFAHCVKIMGRDMVGSFTEPQEVQRRLQRWLDGFISGGSLSGPEQTARYPLQEAQVEVRERRGQPGVYNCTVHLRPQHQLDDIGASFRLVTEFAQRAAAA